MILFKRFLIPAIKNETKTETRRLWDEKTARRHKPGHIEQVRQNYYQKEPDAFIRILSVHPEHLLDITQEGVKAEGFPDGDVEKFITGFKTINSKKVADPGVSYNDWNPELWVVRFKIVKKPQQTKLFEVPQPEESKVQV